MVQRFNLTLAWLWNWFHSFWHVATYSLGHRSQETGLVSSMCSFQPQRWEENPIVQLQQSARSELVILLVHYIDIYIYMYMYIYIYIQKVPLFLAFFPQKGCEQGNWLSPKFLRIIVTDRHLWWDGIGDAYGAATDQSAESDTDESTSQIQPNNSIAMDYSWSWTFESYKPLWMRTLQLPCLITRGSLFFLCVWTRRHNHPRGKELLKHRMELKFGPPYIRLIKIVDISAETSIYSMCQQKQFQTSPIPQANMAMENPFCAL